MRVILDMLADRGYTNVDNSLSDDASSASLEDYMSRNPLVPVAVASQCRPQPIPRPQRIHVVCVPRGIKFNKAMCRELLGEYDQGESILVLYHACTSDVTVEAKRVNSRLELFTWGETQQNITQHALVPTMVPLGKDHIDRLRAKHKGLKFPVLKRDDPVVRYWGFPVNSCVQVDMRLGGQIPTLREIRCIKP